VLEQIQRRAARAILDGDPACVAALRGQARTHVLQASLADQRDDHQHAECRTVSGVLDHVAHRHRTQRARDGQAQCVQGVVAQAGLVGRYLTDQQLHGHLHEHEAHADQRAGTVQRGDVMPDRRQQRAGHHHQRARRHRQAWPDLVNALAGANRQEHRQ
jgi:hypothetical protein